MTMPALFVGHGSPMNALEDNAFTSAWRTVAGEIPRPRAILCVSAHWQTDGPHVTAMERPRTIHDFYGFPPELFRVQYPAPCSPWLAGRVVALGAAHGIAKNSGWGLDHGAWSVLTHLFPAADIPVLQLSLDASKTAAEHYQFATRLRPLRDDGVLILGSGNVVHNLRRMNWQQPDSAYDWAARFNACVRNILLDRDHAALFDLAGDDAKLAVPTPEHYWPLLYVAAQQTPDESIEFFNDHIEYGGIGMLSCRVGSPLKAQQ